MGPNTEQQLDWKRLADAGLGWPVCAYVVRASGLYPGGPEADQAVSNLIRDALWRDHAVRFLLANGVGINTSVPAGQQGPVVETDKFEWMLYRAVEQRLKAEGKL